MIKINREDINDNDVKKLIPKHAVVTVSTGNDFDLKHLRLKNISNIVPKSK